MINFLKIISVYSKQNIFYGPSLELSPCGNPRETTTYRLQRNTRQSHHNSFTMRSEVGEYKHKKFYLSEILQLIYSHS